MLLSFSPFLSKKIIVWRSSGDWRGTSVPGYSVWYNKWFATTHTRAPFQLTESFTGSSLRNRKSFVRRPCCSPADYLVGNDDTMYRNPNDLSTDYLCTRLQVTSTCWLTCINDDANATWSFINSEQTARTRREVVARSIFPRLGFLVAINEPLCEERWTNRMQWNWTRLLLVYAKDKDTRIRTARDPCRSLRLGKIISSVKLH